MAKGGNLVDVDDLRSRDLAGLPAEKSESTWSALRSEERVRFRHENLSSAPLDWGKRQVFSVVDQSFSLVLTADIITQIEQGQDRCGVSRPLEQLLEAAGYLRLDLQPQDPKASGDWWAPSSRVFFAEPDTAPADATAELRQARRSFYTPSVFIDVFGNKSTVQMDESFLMASLIRDAFLHATTFDNDYEHLQPFAITDPNGNSQHAAFDPLGRVIAVAAQGSRADDEDGDDLGGLVSDVLPSDVDAILADPGGDTVKRLLGNAGSRSILLLDRYSRWKSNQGGHRGTNKAAKNSASAGSTPEPALTIQLSRDLSFRRAKDPKIRVAVSYVGGQGELVQELCLYSHTEPLKKWLVDSRTVADAGGSIVRATLPSFASSPDFVPMREVAGLASTAFLEAGVAVASVAPDQTWSKTTTTPWTLTEYGVADLANTKPASDPDVKHLLSRLGTTREQPSWYERQQSRSAELRLAATKSLAYGSSPATTDLGSCGLEIRHSRRVGDIEYVNSFVYDYAGNRVGELEGDGRLVKKSLYDKTNRPLLVFGMDSGEDWALADAQGRPHISWNSRGIVFESRYDRLGRKIESRVSHGSETSPKLAVQTIYGESHPEGAKFNLFGEVWQVKDQSGIHTSTHFDMRGRRLEWTFQPAQEYKEVIDWQQQNAAGETYSHKVTSINNFGEVIEEQDVQGNLTRRTFSLAGHAQTVDFLSVTAQKDSDSSSEAWTQYLVAAEYSADGLLLGHTYGNGVRSEYGYDDASRQLISQKTSAPKTTGRGAAVYEDISTTYDVAGRRVLVTDAAEQTLHFQNCRVAPRWEYTYDALGQLTAATGRAQLPETPADAGGKGVALVAPGPQAGKSPARGVTDGTRLYQYRETYEYDLAGNIRTMSHAATDNSNVSGWTRRYSYEAPSLLSDDPTVRGNRLTRTGLGAKGERDAYDFGYSSDDGNNAGKTGCMTSISGFTLLDWDMHNMLSRTSTQRVTAESGSTPETTYYVYDHAGRRVRKVTESFAAAEDSRPPRVIRSTLYLGGVEIQTKFDGSKPQGTVRWIVPVDSSGSAEDDPGTRLALVETQPASTDGIAAPPPLIRYQTGDNTELDDQGRLVSYEEYSPFGSVLYSAVEGDTAAPRRYRFARYERDGETGLDHCGARYYCAWLGRWTSPDPLGDVDGPNLFQYCGNDPVGQEDHSGTSKFSKAGVGETPPSRTRTKSVRAIIVMTTGVAKISHNTQDSPEEPRDPLGLNAAIKKRMKSHGYEPTFKTYKTEEILPSRKHAAHFPLIRGGGKEQTSREKAKEYEIQVNNRPFEKAMMKSARDFLQEGINALASLQTSRRGSNQDRWDNTLGFLNKNFTDVRELLKTDASPEKKTAAMRKFTESVGEFNDQALGGRLMAVVEGVGTGQILVDGGQKYNLGKVKRNLDGHIEMFSNAAKTLHMKDVRSRSRSQLEPVLRGRTGSKPW